MKSPDPKSRQRILVIDDNPSIHTDFRDILCANNAGSSASSKLEAALFDEETPTAEPAAFELDSAFQGQEGLAMVEEALRDQQPYALAFVDVRMPP
jgi:CheY-like chemotaxis protein